MGYATIINGKHVHAVLQCDFCEARVIWNFVRWNFRVSAFDN